MSKTLIDHNLGRRTDPQEIRNLRSSNFDLMTELGFPVIHKHKWNERDLELGLVRRCPNTDIYGRDHSSDPICFGTGYVGGFADGKIVYVTLGDAPTQIIRPSPQGTLIMDQHPQMNAPWIPEMGDGDLIILADFDPSTWEVLDMHERYELREVNPTTIRGPHLRGKSSPSARWRVGQSSQVDKLPWGHPFYDVPIVFDPGVVPDDDDPNLGGLQSSFEVPVRIRGEEIISSTSTSRDVRVQVAGTFANTSRDVRIEGEGGGTHFHWE
jgi:hypothetical protein